MKASRAPASVERARRRGVARAPGCRRPGRNMLLDQARHRAPAAAMRQLDRVAVAGTAPGRRASKSLARSITPLLDGRRRRDSGNRRRRRLPRRPSSTPSGCSGVQRVPKAGQSGGLRSPLQHQPADAFRSAPRSPARRGAEAALGVEVRHRLRRKPKPALGDLADAAPRARHDRNTSRISACAGAVAVAAHRARVLVLHLARAPPRAGARTLDALQDVERLEPGDHDRHAVARRERLILLDAHDRADMAGGEEALDAVAGRREDGLASPAAPARARPAARSWPMPSRLACVAPPWRWPARWSRSHGEEHDLARRVVARAISQRIERRVDDAHVAAARLDREQVALAARHAQHVAERAEDHLRRGRDLDAPCRSSPAA